MSQRPTVNRKLRPATPARRSRPLPPMPRQVRDAPPPRREREAKRTIFGQPWPLPTSPAVVGILLAFVIAAGLAWSFEGRYETPPAEAAKLVTPYKADDVKEVVVT